MGLLRNTWNKLTQPVAPVAEYQAEPHPATNLNTRTIYSLLELQNKRQIIEVTPAGSDTTFQSMILDVDLNNRNLLLDELYPQPIKPIYPGDRVTLRHTQGTRVLETTVPLLDIADQTQPPIYILALPDEIEIGQRRKHPRIELNASERVHANLISPLRQPWSALALNISQGGARVAVGGDVKRFMIRGSQIPKLELKLAPDFTLHCSARVRSFRYVRKPWAHTQISVEFCQLTDQQKKQLDFSLEAMQTNQVAA